MNRTFTLSLLHRSARRLLVLLTGLALQVPGIAAPANDPTAGDVFNSMQWPTLKQDFLGTAPTQFDDRVKVIAPKFAEDSMNVPVSFDASALQDVGGGIANILVLVDRNPIRKILEFVPHKAKASLGFRFKLEQSSPLRVAVQTRDGIWHVGGVWIDAAGGGCSLPGQTRSNGTWVKTLNLVQARSFASVTDGSTGRLRVRIMHPMDTGLVAGIPAFYLEKIEIGEGSDKDAEVHTPWLTLLTFEPISENPVFSFDMTESQFSRLIIRGRDNNGNPLRAEVTP